jgi:hypothetical protein
MVSSFVINQTAPASSPTSVFGAAAPNPPRADMRQLDLAFLR